MTDTIIDKDVAMDAMGQFQVDDNSDIPIWIQIRKRLVYLIRSGKLDENERLPSVRTFVQLGVNYNTINKVYQDLERDGFIFTRRGKGSYVSRTHGVRGAGHRRRGGGACNGFGGPRFREGHGGGRPRRFGTGEDRAAHGAGPVGGAAGAAAGGRRGWS